jgi:hypothetical protein
MAARAAANRGDGMRAILGKALATGVAAASQPGHATDAGTARGG